MVDTLNNPRAVFIQLLHLGCSNNLANKLIGAGLTSLRRWRRETPYRVSPRTQNISCSITSWLEDPRNAIHAGALLHNFKQLGALPWLERIINAYENYCMLNTEHRIGTLDLAYAIMTSYRDQDIEHITCSDCRFPYFGIIGEHQCPLCLIKKNRFCGQCGDTLPIREKKRGRGRHSTHCSACQKKSTYFINKQKKLKTA